MAYLKIFKRWESLGFSQDDFKALGNGIGGMQSLGFGYSISVLNKSHGIPHLFDYPLPLSHIFFYHRLK